MNILWAVIWFTVLGSVIGFLLAFADKVFNVHVDDRIIQIGDLLPGANCGGCGYSGCKALATAIVDGKASPTACTAAKLEASAEISGIIGLKFVTPIKMRAQVMCSGTLEHAKKKYIYSGAHDCVSAVRLGGGNKVCPNGCIGLGTCVSKCKFDAITVVDGVAVVDYKKCTGCGTCVSACPKRIIKLIPFNNEHWVGCMSVENAKDTRSYCDVGCISCRLCEKSCGSDAIHVDHFVASIIYNKCIECGTCVEKCPRHIIWSSKKQTQVGVIISKELLKDEVEDISNQS